MGVGMSESVCCGCVFVCDVCVCGLVCVVWCVCVLCGVCVCVVCGVCVFFAKLQMRPNLPIFYHNNTLLYCILSF